MVPALIFPTSKAYSKDFEDVSSMCLLYRFNLDQDSIHSHCRIDNYVGGIKLTAPGSHSGSCPLDNLTCQILDDPEFCLDLSCFLITKARPLGGGQFEICAIPLGSGPHNWTMGVGGIPVPNPSELDPNAPCWIVNSGYNLSLSYFNNSDTCIAHFVIPEEYKCPEDLITFNISPGCPPKDVTISVNQSLLASGRYYVIDFGDESAIFSDEAEFVRTYPSAGTYEVCITQCLETLRFVSIGTCCYTFDITIESCEDADFDFSRNIETPSCINPEFTVSSHCNDTVYNEHIWIFSDGKTYHGLHPPLSYHFTDFVNTTGEVCVTHMVICCGDTLEPVTKCLPHPTGAYLGWVGESRRLSDPIEPWANTVGDFIDAYAHDLSVPLLIDGDLIFDVHRLYHHGWWHMGEAARILNEGRLFGLTGTTIQSAGRHARNYPCCRWQGVDNAGPTHTWWAGATVTDAWRMLHYPASLAGGGAPAIRSRNGYYHTNLMGIRSDIPVVFSVFRNNQLIGHRSDLSISESCDCTAINAIDFRSDFNGGPVININDINGTINMISHYEQGFHFYNFGLNVRHFELFDLQEYPPSTTLSSWNNPPGTAAIGIDFLWEMPGITTLDYDRIHFRDLHQQDALSAAVNALVGWGKLYYKAIASDPLNSITVKESRHGYLLKVGSNATIDGSISSNSINTRFGGVNLHLGPSSAFNRMWIDANEINTTSQFQDNYGIQLGGGFQPLLQEFRIRHNEISNSSQQKGNAIAVSNVLNTLIAQNIIVNGNTGYVQGIRLEQANNSEVRCNLVENYRNGLYAIGARDAQYSANTLLGSRWNFRLGMMSAATQGTTVRWNQFLDQTTGVPHVIYENDGITWPQDHSMYNTWDWSGLNPETELQHLDPSNQNSGGAYLSRYLFPLGAASPSAHRPLFAPDAFMEPADDASITEVWAFCALPAPPWDPNDQQLTGPLDSVADAFNFYQDLIEADSLWSSYSPAQRAALQQHVYSMALDSTAWHTSAAIDDFLESHANGFVGQSVMLERDMQAYHATIAAQQAYLGAWMEKVDSLQAVMMAHYSMAADSANIANRDSLLALGDALLPAIEAWQDSLTANQMVFDSLNALTLSALATDNTSMGTYLLHEAYEQIMNALIIQQLAGIVWDSTDIGQIQTIAATCYTDGGRAVWQARAICRYSFFEWYEEEGCITPLRSAAFPSGERLHFSTMSIKIDPNPTKDMALISFHGIEGTETVDLRLIDASGRIIRSLQGISTRDKVVQLTLHDVPAGIYTVTVSNADHTASARMVVHN